MYIYKICIKDAVYLILFVSLVKFNFKDFFSTVFFMHIKLKLFLFLKKKRWDISVDKLIVWNILLVYSYT